MISARLNSFLQGNVWKENRRVAELIDSIRRLAIENPARAAQVSMEMYEPGIVVNLPMEKQLFAPPSKGVVFSDNIEVAEDSGEGVFFDIFYIDKSRLAQNIDEALRGRAQATLAQVVAMFPIRQGPAGAFACLELAANSDSAFFDESAREAIAWRTDAGAEKMARLNPVSLENCEEAKKEISKSLQGLIKSAGDSIEKIGSRIAREMTRLKDELVALAQDFTADAGSLKECKELLVKLEQDDLPRFEARFNKMLKQETIEDMALFNGYLGTSAKKIQQRVECINGALRQIEYNPYICIRLEVIGKTPDKEIRQFKEDAKERARRVCGRRRGIYG